MRCKQPSETQKPARKAGAKILLHGDNCAVSQAKLLSVHEVWDEACLNRLGLQEAEMNSKKQAKGRLSLLFGVKLHGGSIFSIKN